MPFMSLACVNKLSGRDEKQRLRTRSFAPRDNKVAEHLQTSERRKETANGDHTNWNPQFFGIV